MTLICCNFELNDTNILRQVECMLSQQERVPVISKSNVNVSITFWLSFQGPLFPKPWQQMPRWNNRLSSCQKEDVEVN